MSSWYQLGDVLDGRQPQPGGLDASPELHQTLEIVVRPVSRLDRRADGDDVRHADLAGELQVLSQSCGSCLCEFHGAFSLSARSLSADLHDQPGRAAPAHECFPASPGFASSPQPRHSRAPTSHTWPRRRVVGEKRDAPQAEAARQWQMAAQILVVIRVPGYERHAPESVSPGRQPPQVVSTDRWRPIAAPVARRI
jgi:hypothetical protein